MKNKTKLLLAAICTVSILSGCGKKDDAISQNVSSSTSSPVEDNTPRFKKTEKFGTVSNIILTPVFQVPPKFNSYVRQEVSELSKDEYQKLSDVAFEGYVSNWIKQAASVEKPDWSMIAGIVHPEFTEETNEFKKQEIIDKTKSEITIDKSKINVVYGWQGEMLSIAGPDVTTGEYYLYIKPHSRFQSVSYENSKNYRYSLYYRPVFDAVGMSTDNLDSMQLTVKVPIEKAKEIESMREGNVPMIRVYGRVVGVDANSNAPLLRKNFSEAPLGVAVEALEFGTRKNGEFKTFFILDSDQLKRSK